MGGSSNVDGSPHADSLSPATHPMHPCIHACWVAVCRTHCELSQAQQSTAFLPRSICVCTAETPGFAVPELHICQEKQWQGLLPYTDSAAGCLADDQVHRRSRARRLCPSQACSSLGVLLRKAVPALRQAQPCSYTRLGDGTQLKPLLNVRL